LHAIRLHQVAEDCLKLLVIRHAIAVAREEFATTGRADDARPLTKVGRAKMQQGVRGLLRVVPRITLLATSPLVRARQTARIVSAAYADGLDVEETDVLRPDAANSVFLAWARERRDRPLVAVVGHEPHLSSLVSWLLTGDPRPVLQLKKGAACLLEMGATPRRGNASLLWALAPAHLRALGR
jgi:phosphohistidine phosphatase